MASLPGEHVSAEEESGGEIRTPRKPGRPRTDAELRELIRRMGAEYRWGAPRIHGELLKLGLRMSERTVSSYLRSHRPRRPSGSSWKKIVAQIMKDLDSMEAEWSVLDRFVRDGWEPMPTQRSASKPDWRLKKGNELNVDSKYKASPASCCARLAWILRGAAMLPDRAFLQNFNWSWSVPNNCRDKTVALFADHFLAVLPQVEALARSFSIFEDPTELMTTEQGKLVFEPLEKTVLATLVIHPEFPWEFEDFSPG